MGRTAAQVKDFIIYSVAQKTNLSVLAANTDDEAILKQFMECAANVIATHNQVADQHIADVEQVLDFINPHTATWVQQRVLEFQYDADTPQILIDVNGIIQYQIPDETKRIITNCAVITNASRQPTIIIAKNNPLEKVSDEEKAAVEGYLNNVLSPSFALAGAQALVTTYDPDYCFIEAEVKYDGLFAGSINENVTNAINGYLSNLGVAGKVSPYELAKAVKIVPGVKNFIIKNMALRSNSTVFGSKTDLVLAFTDTLVSPLATTAGYCYTEVEPGEDLQTKLTFTRV